MISLIAAAGGNGTIGNRGKIPWRLPADFAYFQKITMGHPVIMGRKTFESIGKALPGRKNIVITRDENYRPEGVVVVHSLEKAYAAARQGATGGEIFVIGGAQIYREALPSAQRIYLTRVSGNFEGDAFFPAVEEANWALMKNENHPKDEKNQYDFSFLVYERKL